MNNIIRNKEDLINFLDTNKSKEKIYFTINWKDWLIYNVVVSFFVKHLYEIFLNWKRVYAGWTDTKEDLIEKIIEIKNNL